MFCPKCGKQLPDHATFCTSCGAQLAAPAPAQQPECQSAPQMIAQPVPQPAAPPETQGRKSSAMPLAVVVIVLAIILVALLAILGLRSCDSTAESAFGDTAIDVAGKTHIVPIDEGGELMVDASAQLMCINANGEVTYAWVAKVKDSDGVSIADFGDDIPDGSYTLVITSKDGISHSVDLKYFKNGDAPARQEVSDSSDPEKRKANSTLANDYGKEAAKLSLDKLYYDKCQELVDQYGEPSTGQGDYDYLRDVKGLCFTKVIDFDTDGINELLLFYNNGSGEFNCYQIQIWKAVDQTCTEIKLAYDGTTQDDEISNGWGGNPGLYGTNGGCLTLHISTVDGKPYVITGGADGGADAGLVGDMGDGSIGIVHRLSISDFSDDDGTLDGKPITSSKGWKVLESWFSNSVSYAMNHSGWEGCHSDRETIATVRDTMETLYHEPPAVPASDDEGEDSGVGTVTYEMKTVNVRLEPPSDYNIDGMDAEWHYPQFSVTGDSAGADTVNALIADDFQGEAARQENGAESVYTDVSCEVEYIQGSVVSVVYSKYLYAWGAHGTTSISCVLFDLQSGKQINIEDYVGVSLDDMRSAARSAYLTALDNVGDVDEWAEDGVSAIDNWESPHFILTSEGIAVVTDDYQIGSYARGQEGFLVMDLEGNPVTDYRSYKPDFD